MYGVKDHKH